MAVSLLYIQSSALSADFYFFIKLNNEMKILCREQEPCILYKAVETGVPGGKKSHGRHENSIQTPQSCSVHSSEWTQIQEPQQSCMPPLRSHIRSEAEQAAGRLLCFFWYNPTHFVFLVFTDQWIYFILVFLLLFFCILSLPNGQGSQLSLFQVSKCPLLSPASS